MSRFLLSMPICLGLTCVACIQASGAQPITQSVDRALERYWEEQGVEPTGQASDLVFLRRVSLDLAGVTPRVAEVRDFAADTRPDKRERLVARLLASSRHAAHMANVWRDRLLPAEAGGFERQQQAVGLRNWLRDRFDSNLRYDNLVYELLVATDASDLGPASYFAAHELKPEKLAASATQRFLGVSLECAMCHDHPYTTWEQDDFWAFAAYFARIKPVEGYRRMAMPGQVAMLTDADYGELYMPEDYEESEPIAPRPLGGSAAEEIGFESRREQLALWMTERANPYLARAAVNEAWMRLFGRGLVEEINADGDHLPSDHALLLDELADEFVKSGYDLKRLYQALALTHAYQLAARSPEEEPRPELAFAEALPRQLSPEQLCDSLSRLAPSLSASRDPFAPDPTREAFIQRMRTASENPLEYSGSTLQALMMLHGNRVQGVTAAPGAGIVPALSDPSLSNEERVETLFLSTLTRLPSESERTAFIEYLEEHGQASQLTSALGDIAWSLLNSSEMNFNH